MPKVIYERDGRVGRITLNRPEVMNAIDNELPVELADCVTQANADEKVHVIVLSGAGRAFCSGYDLKLYAERSASHRNPVEPAGTSYAEFEATFPFEETRDQEKAIDDVMADLDEGHELPPVDVEKTQP